jgi:pyruvate formate lyase activating enzyme
MKIKAIEKVTLIDYPGKIACTLFLFGCNFKCGFCHNPELVIKEGGKSLSPEEVLSFLISRKGYLEGVCITGGEPLLTLDKDFLRKIKELGYEIKIDTNGSFPEKLKELIKEKLIDFISMDIKSSKENYERICNVKIDFNKIEESIKLISNFKDYEFRSTIIEDLHDEEDIKKMCEWLKHITGKKLKKLCLQGFKNSGKFVDEKFKEVKDTKEEYLKDLKRIAHSYFEEVEIRI